MSPRRQLEAEAPPRDAALWTDRPVAIIGAGPSLHGVDLSLFRDRRWRTLAVKETIFDMPWAEAGFGLDMPWMHRRKDEIVASRSRFILSVPFRQPHLWELMIPPPRDGIYYLDRREGDDLSDDPNIIASGGTSGHGALNLAYLMRAPLVVLFGFDYGTAPGRHHYRDDRYQFHFPGHWKAWSERFVATVPQIVASGMTVLNACPVSQIPCFEKCRIDEGLSRMRAWHEQPQANIHRL